MSVGPLGGIAGSVAGSPLAQSKGSDVERAQQDAANQTRRTKADQKAENAAGIGEADGEDHEAADRDARAKQRQPPDSAKPARPPLFGGFPALYAGLTPGWLPADRPAFGSLLFS